jgi:hypothetical protein
MAGLALVWMMSAPRPVWGQWTGGPTGPIYYNGGNVGIGTTSPGGLLHIAGSVGTNGLVLDNGVQIRQKNASGTITNVLTRWSDNVIYLDNPDGAINIRPGPSGASSVFLTATGNVGIGTTNPQYLLSVKGQIGAKDVIVTNTGWSDYVFQPGYRLRPLREVDAYIHANHHLPDIPSAAEVQEKGVSMGDMQSKLLAKIEELTLHMIQQDKENRNLRERIAQLEAHAAGVPSGPGAPATARFVRVRKATARLALCFCACNMMTAFLAAQCSNPTQVPNQTISSGTLNFTDNNALAASNVIINGSASVTFQAGNCIDLQPGFHATAGTAAATLHAWVGTGVPSITSLSVTSGTVGTAVTITGSNFGSSGTVTFNGTTATVTSWSAGSITATVPVGAAPGSVNVVVTANGVASNAAAFTLQDSAPSYAPVTPSSGSGWQQTYSFTFSDPNGATDISWTQMDVGNSSGTANSCVVFFGRGPGFGYGDPSTGGFWLGDNAGQGWSGGGPVGQPGTLENSQCIVDVGASSLQLSGTSLTITVAASFKTGYAAAHTIWDMAEDNEGLSSGGYYGAGSYTVTTPPAPLFSLAAQQVTAQPIAPGSSASYTVTVTPQSGFSGVVKFENTALATGETAALLGVRGIGCGDADGEYGQPGHAHGFDQLLGDRHGPAGWRMGRKPNIRHP